MSSTEDELNDCLAMVPNWLEENVRVVTHANALTLCDFTYSLKKYSGEFSIRVDGELLDGRWHFWLYGADGRTADCLSAYVHVPTSRPCQLCCY
jgi:hypothetical protein